MSQRSDQAPRELPRLDPRSAPLPGVAAVHTVSEQRFRQIAEHLSDAVWLSEPGTGRLVYVNPTYRSLWEGSGEEPLATNQLESIHPDDLERARALLTPTLEGKAEGEFRLRRPTGGVRWVRIHRFPLPDDDGRLSLIAGIARDVTEQRRTEEELRRANSELAARVAELGLRNLQMLALSEMVELLQSCNSARDARETLAHGLPEIFPHGSGVVFLISTEGTVLEPVAPWGNLVEGGQAVAPDDCWALRRCREHWVDPSLQASCCGGLHPPPTARDLCIPLTAHGECLGALHLRPPAPESGEDVEAGAGNNLALLRFGINVAEQIAMGLANVKLRESLRTQAIQDPLTGLFNRRYLNDALERELRRAARRESSVGLLMIDLDHFKLVNDTLGHDAGDTMLREFACLLTRQFRGEDIIARWGGEEFVVLLPDCSLADSRRLGEELRRAIKKLRVRHGGRLLPQISLSVGVAAMPDSGLDAETLLKGADAALYRSKAEGRDRVSVATVRKE